jgi:uncharacterized protein YbaA (DUF1428 family)
MGYIEGFVTAVPAANKEVYRQHAAEAAPMFKAFGATRVVEAWGDDVPDGKLNDLKSAVKAKPEEVVVFSWIEYPSKAVRDAANAKMMSDPKVKEMAATMPFDGQRMIFGGFATVVEERAEGAGRPSYVDGCLLPVPVGGKSNFVKFAKEVAALFREHGAVRVVDAWGDDVPDGKVTDFRSAVLAKDGEAVVYGWVEWPSKEARDRGWEKVMADPRAHAEGEQAPFDGQRMVFGGFTPILDT